MRCDCGHDFETGLNPQETLTYVWKDLIKRLTEALYARIGFPFKCPKCSKRHSNKTTHCRCGFEYTEAKLANLINLSTETAIRDTSIDLDDPKDIVLKCVEVTGAARSYCSRQIFRDPTTERDYDIEWRLDFVKPDRFHVSQVMWDDDLGELFDEWVVLGEEYYQNAGLWAKARDSRVAEGRLEKDLTLLADNCLTILRTEEFVSSESHQYQGNDYLLLKYENIDLSGDPPNTGQEGLETRLSSCWRQPVTTGTNKCL